MELIFTTSGTYLSVKDGLFLVSVNKQKTAISPLKVERIIVSTEAVLTTAAIQLAVENNIDLVILNRNGEPVGRFWHSKFGSITTIRRKQLQCNMGNMSIDTAREWVVTKLSNHLEFVKELAKNRPKHHDLVLEKATTISTNIQTLSQLTGNIDDKRGTIIGLEGSASRVYFEILSLCIPEHYRFTGRSRQPARDPFNAYLNYAYGILYSTVWIFRKQRYC